MSYLVTRTLLFAIDVYTNETETLMISWSVRLTPFSATHDEFMCLLEFDIKAKRFLDVSECNQLKDRDAYLVQELIRIKN